MPGQRTGNPLDSRMGRGALANGEEASVLRVFTRAGAPWVECEHPQTGQRWTAPVLVPASGPNSLVHLPLEGSSDPERPGTRVQLLFVNSYRTPVVVGCRLNSATKLGTSTPATHADEDRTAPAATSDVVLKNGGTELTISGDGDLTVDSADATGDGMVRVQLKDGAALRISRGGKAEERLVLAGPLLDYLGKLEAYTKGLEARLLKLEAGAPDPATIAAQPTQPTASVSKFKAAAIAISADAEG